jgi:para-nitrobenzyl esterase
MRSLAVAEQQGLALAAKLGAKSSADLRALSVDAILDAHPGLGFWPIVDGHFLREKPVETFAKGEQADVPLLAGWNKDEGFNFNVMNWPQAKNGYEHFVTKQAGKRAKEVLALYPAGRRAASSAKALGGDLVIKHGTWAWLEAHRSTAKSNVFRYRFDRAPKTPRGWIKGGAKAGAFHSCEIPYVMDNLDAFSWLVNVDDQKVANMSADYLVNFVKAGNPNGSGLPEWPSYRENNRPALFIDVEPSIGHDADRARHELLASLLT